MTQVKLEEFSWVKADDLDHDFLFAFCIIILVPHFVAYRCWCLLHAETELLVARPPDQATRRNTSVLFGFPIQLSHNSYQIQLWTPLRLHEFVANISKSNWLGSILVSLISWSINWSTFENMSLKALTMFASLRLVRPLWRIYFQCPLR